MKCGFCSKRMSKFLVSIQGKDIDENQRDFHREIVTELLRIQKGESK